MTGLLPPTVESYLIESGFTITEIVVLHKLLEGEALTLRELAAKTGKGTGVLDKATKKLLKRGILMRETINDKPKFVVKSLEAIQQWMKRDMEEKRRYLERREQDFDTFLNSLSMDQARPEIEHFEGEEGICKAYTKLLTLSEKELLFYVPVKHKEEEDPLRAFRVQHFRARHKRSVFSRVIAPDTALGRRYQSRDVFEYRRTALIPESRFPVMFEKVIAGDTIACFDHAKQSACFMRYPQMADSERRMFEREWREALESRGEEKEAPEEDEEEEVSLSTATLSAIREFLLSRKSIAAFIACAVLAAGVTYGLYRQNVYLNTQRVRERLTAIVSTAVLKIDPLAIEKLIEMEKVNPQLALESYELEEVIDHMKGIRDNNKNIRYIYIWNKTDDPAYVAFTADAEMIEPIDIDGNGIIEGVEIPPEPGELYATEGVESLDEGFIRPIAQTEFIVDKWGIFMTAFAPIKDSDGNAVAVLGVDMTANDVRELSRESFKFLLYFIGFFLLFVLIRLAAFNRPLMKELLKLIDTKEVMILLGSSALLSLLITFGTYKYSYHLNLQRVRERVMAIAATAAPEFDAGDLEELHTWRDTEKPVYAKVVKQLQDIRERNEGVVYVYIMRPTGEENIFAFVADADSLNLDAKIDLNGDGVIDEADHLSPPGELYDDTQNPTMYLALEGPMADEEPATDQWGTWISGTAPIFDANGEAVSILGVDIDASEVTRLTQKSLKFTLLCLGLFALFILFGLAVYSKNLRSDLLKLINAKAVLVTLGVCSLIALGITYGMYRYTLNIMKDEVGQRLMSIAATAAPEIDAKDLEVLRIAKDMEREEYQRVFGKLNEIRDRNEDQKIVWIYILRPTEEKNIWEWVVDADSNYDIPNSGIDYNGDGVIDEADEGVAPGVMYDATGMTFTSVGLIGPMIEDFGTDQWGTFLTGFAPIRDQEGDPVALLGVDMELSDFYHLIKEKFSPFLWFFSAFGVLMIVGFAFSIKARR